MILSFSGYISKDNVSKVMISVEISFPEDSLLEKINPEEIYIKAKKILNL